MLLRFYTIQVALPELFEFSVSRLRRPILSGFVKNLNPEKSSSNQPCSLKYQSRFSQGITVLITLLAITIFKNTKTVIIPVPRWNALLLRLFFQVGIFFKPFHGVTWMETRYSSVYREVVLRHLSSCCSQLWARHASSVFHHCLIRQLIENVITRII